MRGFRLSKGNLADVMRRVLENAVEDERESCGGLGACPACARTLQLGRGYGRV